MSITLYRKYRPNNFTEVFGQENIKKSIINALNDNKIAHAYLFNGPRGTGKTTIARLIAKGVNCLTNGISSNPCDSCKNCLDITSGVSLDVIEIDAASNRGIDEIRILKENINYQPVNSRMKVYIIDEVHMLTNEAFNALLKTLEEPPIHAMFILATTEIHKLPDTIISRCVTYNFKTLSETEIIEMLSNLSKKENKQISNEALELVYKKSGGSARDSLSLLEQVFSSCANEKIEYSNAAKSLGLIEQEYFEKFNKILHNQDKRETIDFINQIYKNGIPIDIFLKDFCDYLRNNENDLNYVISIIGKIYEILAKYKNEEDLRIISYLILYNLFDNTTTKQNIVVSQNIKVEQEFVFKDFLQYLENNGSVVFFNALNNYVVNKVENYTIYLKQKNDRKEARALFSDEIVKRQLEDEIYNFANMRYVVSFMDSQDIKRENLISDIISLFEAERI